MTCLLLLEALECSESGLEQAMASDSAMFLFFFSDRVSRAQARRDDMVLPDCSERINV